MDLLNEAIAPALTRLALPIMATSLVQMLYNLTDMAWIGRLGAGAVTAVGSAGMIPGFHRDWLPWLEWEDRYRLHNVSVVVKKKKHMVLRRQRCSWLPLWGWHMRFCRLCLRNRWVGFFQLADAEAHAAAMSYTKIACGLIVFSFMTLTLTGLYTAQGDSKNTVFWRI